MKSAVVVALIIILASLASALLYLFKDDASSKRTVKALTVRIGLSMALFLAIVAGVLTGVITPNQPF
ncbi:twin transmembrane helix small protein [Alkalilimnicola ehrlichii]|uniref:Twin transmembrane helix small protein n=1 Tax=Alkalilimnicola ehrlichii TaxID=351052 RepID=A0A3E0X4M8_9GAMM|nr:twin transmembrane helix small protein [Alkalilimnicola ehrlichii]RFA39645.1 twin transmembrane helix small protein [Alkalilimnicola ehrlichii]